MTKTTMTATLILIASAALLATPVSGWSICPRYLGCIELDPANQPTLYKLGDGLDVNTGPIAITPFNFLEVVPLGGRVIVDIHDANGALLSRTIMVPGAGGYVPVPLAAADFTLAQTVGQVRAYGYYDIA